MAYKVIFSDIDGTIVDITGKDYGNIDVFVKKIKDNHIPLVLCSAKTYEEQQNIRNKLGIDDPFIVENGGAIFIPKNYFKDISIKNKEIDGHNVIEIGTDAETIRNKLKRIRRENNINFLMISDLSIEELSKVVDIPYEYAKRMAQRAHSETILEINEEDIARFKKEAKRHGLKVMHGGRYYGISIGNDKGKAVDILLDLYKKNYNGKIASFGVGDSENDYYMLNRVDYPMLVQKADGKWSNILIDKIIKIQGIGPQGTCEALQKIINY